jgi:spiro-SPASM protein
VTDLSPLKRFACWHLKRDLHVLIDGSVPVCREDLEGGKILGNILTDDLREIWDRGTPWYLRHLDGDYPELCKGCDEYYTYNF